MGCKSHTAAVFIQKKPVLLTKNVVNCSEFFYIPKLPDGFEFFPCLFNRVSPEYHDSMKLKKYQVQPSHSMLEL